MQKALTELDQESAALALNALTASKKPEIARLFAAKEARRHKLAALPFPEKVRAVVRLQEMAAPVLRARGKKVRVWALDNRVT